MSTEDVYGRRGVTAMKEGERYGGRIAPDMGGSVKRRERHSILIAWRTYRKEGIRKPQDEKTKNLSKSWERKRSSGKAKEKRGFETAKDTRKCRGPWGGPRRK